MTKNKLEDLNNHLFEQLERLNDDDLSSEDIGNLHENHELLEDEK